MPENIFSNILMTLGESDLCCRHSICYQSGNFVTKGHYLRSEVKWHRHIKLIKTSSLSLQFYHIQSHISVFSENHFKHIFQNKATASKILVSQKGTD